MDPARLSHATEYGRITISPDVIARIVGETAAECYGVVGMSGKGRVARLLARERPTQGIEVDAGDDGLRIGLHVVVERGLNLAEVAATVRSRVSYEVQRITGLPVAAVEVHIRGVRRSA